jgi:hypothetical protein
MTLPRRSDGAPAKEQNEQDDEQDQDEGADSDVHPRVVPQADGWET